MRVGIHWLRDWVEIDEDPARIAEELTTAGLEVDGVEPAGPNLAGLVVGRIVSVQPHPNADRLSLCVVDDGRTQHDVVCGAPNVAADLHVPYAPIGTRLPGGQTIEAAEIRGTASDGMLCSAAELRLADDAAGLLVLDADAEPGTPMQRYLNLDDAVLDVDLTPNRGDCFSVLGIAREIAARRGVALRGPAHEPVPPGGADEFGVELAAGEACPRFAARVVRQIDPSRRTPVWMRERLRRAGLRAIHPVVDVTNYVMLELGQPLHAYNLAKLDERIVVRFARAGERLVLLDGNEVELDDDVLAITDASGPIGLAGIMGGAGSAVSAETRDVLFEAAYFSPDAIAGRARRYALHTDASLRFERGVDFALQERAIERATALLQAIAGGVAGPVRVEERRDLLPERRPIILRHQRLENLLGLELPADEVASVLERLHMQVEAHGGAWSVVPPSYRFDLEIEEDLVEEVGRLIGYDRIPATHGPVATSLGTATEGRVDPDAAADTLVARGYSEVITYSFIDEASARAVSPDDEVVELANPISSDMKIMRRSLWPGLLKTAHENLSRQQHRLRLFEIGHEFEAAAERVVERTVLAGLAVGPRWPEQWDAPADADVDFFDVKADVEALLRLTGQGAQVRFAAAAHPALMPGQTARIDVGADAVGWIGAVHPGLLKSFDLKTSAVVFSLDIERAFAAALPHYAEYSRFPAVRRDLAVVVDENVPVQQLVDHVRAAAGPLLKRVVPFDVYRGEKIDLSRKSVALGLILQDTSRTLTDDDADATVQSVTQHLERELGATIRT